MITSRGNQIISKYLLGQAPEYAAYIAVGTGAKPLDLDETDSSPITKQSMDFEAFRVPVLSRGLVNDNIVLDVTSWSVSSNLVTIETASPHGTKLGDEITLSFSLSSSANLLREGTFVVTSTTSNTIDYEQTTSLDAWYSSASASDTATVSYNRERIVFKAELPTDQRYEMTEIALYPAANNSLALNYDSKVVAGFLTTEGWTYHDVSGSLVESDNTIPFVTTSIANSAGNIGSATFVDPTTSLTASALFVNSNNEVFTFPERKARYENPRFYNRCLIVPGNMTSFSSDSMTLVGQQKYIFTNSLKLNLSQNSPNDYIKFALSVISADNNPVGPPDRVRLRFEFLDSLSGDKAVVTHLLDSGDLTTERYKIISKQLKDFDLGTDFSWSRIDGIVIYAQTLDDSDNYDGSYVAFDGIRVDNENTENPLYAMVAYSKLKNNFDDGQPIQKLENSQGYIEYRLGVNIA
jgi:hypothetical protein